MVGSSNLPVATKVAVLPNNIENLPLRQLLEMLLGEEGKRKLRLRQMTNEELFTSYDADLINRHQSARALKEARRVLGHYRLFMGQWPPSPESGKRFLAQFATRKTTTRYRYTQIIGSFLKWYGEDLGITVRVPKKLPQYVELEKIQRLLDAMSSRPTHKRNLGRDLLLVETATKSGLRRQELANLKIGDLHLDLGILIVRNGKGGKDASVPIPATLIARLRAYTHGMASEASLFGLRPSSISGKIEYFAKKAGVDIHTHSLRHFYGTTLIERGANPEAVRQLMRHENLATTQRYVSLRNKGLKEAAELLDQAVSVT